MWKQAGKQQRKQEEKTVDRLTINESYNYLMAFELDNGRVRITDGRQSVEVLNRHNAELLAFRLGTRLDWN